MKRAHNRAMWICVVTTLAAQGVAQAQEKQNFRARDCYAGSVELMPKNIKGDIGLYDPNIPNYFVGTYHMVGTRTLLEGPDFLKNLSTECLGFNIYKDKRVDFGKGACTYLTGDGSPLCYGSKSGERERRDSLDDRSRIRLAAETTRQGDIYGPGCLSAV